MEELKRLIIVSYGNGDKIFSNHASERKNARIAIMECAKQNVGFDEYIAMHKEHLTSIGLNTKQVSAQIKRVKTLEFYF